MPAGKYRESIKLLAPQVPSINDAGEATTATKKAWKTKAAVSTQSAKEIARNGLIEADVTYTFEIRYRSDIQESWQIEYDGKTLAISKVVPVDQRKFELSILATEIK